MSRRPSASRNLLLNLARDAARRASLHAPPGADPPRPAPAPAPPAAVRNGRARLALPAGRARLPAAGAPRDTRLQAPASAGR
jgi:hypothetical protein